MDGREESPPDGIIELLIAEEWHIPPWQIEDEGREIWVERWRALRTERYRKQQQEAAGGD